MKPSPRSFLLLPFVVACDQGPLLEVPCTPDNADFIEASGELTIALGGILDGVGSFEDHAPKSAHGKVREEAVKLKKYFDGDLVVCSVPNPQSDLEAAGGYSKSLDEIQINVGSKFFQEHRDEEFDKESMDLLVQMINKTHSNSNEELAFNEFAWQVTENLIDVLVEEGYVANEDEAALYVQENILSQMRASSSLSVLMIHEAAHAIHLLSGDEMDEHNNIEGANKCKRDKAYGAGSYYSNIATLFYDSMRRYIQTYHPDLLESQMKGLNGADAACEYPFEWSYHYVQP